MAAGRELRPSSIPERITPDAQLLWVLQGRARVVADGVSHEVEEHGGLHIPAGLRHRIDTDPDSIALPIVRPGRPAGAGPAAVAPVGLPVKWEPWLIHLFAQNLGYLRGSPAAAPSLFGTVPAADGGAAPGAAPLLPTSEASFQVARLLVGRPELPDTLAELAARVGASPRTIQRQFLRETGLSFAAWRGQVRIWAAAGYLSQGCEIGWVAARVGFTNASAFARSFRALRGMTPRAFRVAAGASAPSRPASAALPAPGASPPPIPAGETWPRVNRAHVAVWVYRGRAQVDIGERSWELAVGDAVIMPAGVTNQVRVAADSLLLPIGFRWSGDIALPASALTVVHFEEEETPFLLHSLVATYTPLALVGHQAEALFDEMVERAVTALPPDRAGVAGDQPAERAVALASHLLGHLNDATSLTEWARRSGTEVATLREAFRSATGMGFAQWRQLIRMTHAREQLRLGIAPSTIARSLGYAQLSGFSRAFTRAHGMSPRRYLAEATPTPAAVAGYLAGPYTRNR